MTELLATVAIPVLNEEQSIEECLGRLQAQSYEPLEILVADGGSHDATRSLVESLAALDERITLVENPRRLQSAGLNEILSRASGDVIVRLDARSFVDTDYVARSIDSLLSTGAAVVGGRMVPRPRSGLVPEGIALANRSAWGAGPARFHRGGTPGPVETVYLGSFRRSWLETVRGWAEDVGVNEDYELNHRIRSAGGIVWFDPQLQVEYEPRTSYRGLATQYFRYGRSKSVVMWRHPASVRPRQVAPAALGFVGAVGLVPGRIGRLARLLVLGHVGLVAALASNESEPLTVRLAAAGAGWVMHWAWALGWWVGLLQRVPAAGER